MRKITTLLMLLLLCSIGAKAQDRWDTGYSLVATSTPPQAFNADLSEGFYVLMNNGIDALLCCVPGEAPRLTEINSSSYQGQFQSYSAFFSGEDFTKAYTNNKAYYVVKITPNTAGTACTIQFADGTFLSNWAYNSATDLISSDDTPSNIKFKRNEYYFVFYNGYGNNYVDTSNFYLGRSEDDGEGTLYTSAYKTWGSQWKLYPVQLEKDDGGDEGPSEYDPYTLNVGHETGHYMRVKEYHEYELNEVGALYDKAYAESHYTYFGSGTASPKGSNWAYKWVSEDESNLQIWVDIDIDAKGTRTNKFDASREHVLQTAGSGGIPWKISVADGYVITGWKVVASTAAATSKLTDKGYINDTEFTTDGGTFEQTGLNQQEVSFTTKSNDGSLNAEIIWSTFQVTVKKVPATPVETKHTLTVNYSAWGSSEAPFIVKKEIAEGENVTASDIELEYYKDFDADVTFPFEMTSDKTVNVDCTPDFPFVSGNVYGLIDDYKKLYFEYNTSQSGTHITRYHGLTAPQFNRSTYWVFEHVPGTQNLFTLYNMQEKKYVTMSELPTTKVADANNATYAKYPTLTDAPTTWTEGLVPTSYFRITKQNDNCFHMEHPADPTLVASNAHNYSIILWWGDAAPANSKSGFQTKDIKASLTEALSLEAERQEITSDYITAQTLTRFTASAKALLTSVANGTEEPTKSNIAQIIDGFTSVSDTFDELVDEDAIYQIIFTRGDNVMGMYNAEADKDGVASTEKEIAKPMTALQDTEVDSKNITNTLWRFVKNGTRFNIQHVNGNLYLGAFMNDDETGSRAYISSTRNQAEAAGFEVEGDGSDVWAIKNPESTWQKSGSGAYRMYFNSTYQTTSGGNKNHYIGAYTSGLSDSGSTLKVKKISTLPLSVSAAGWTAFCFPVKVVVPDGVTVYQATSSNGESLHLEEVAAGTVLPAGAGFLCEAAEGTYNFGITAADAADFSSNLLTGATLRRTGMTPNNFYALGNKNGVGFYRVNSETVPANKPFLPASALTSSVREMLSFDFGMATGISNTQNADRTDTSVLYDLNGRRVYYPVRGIYVNGRGEKIFLNK